MVEWVLFEGREIWVAIIQGGKGRADAFEEIYRSKHFLVQTIETLEKGVKYIQS